MSRRIKNLMTYIAHEGRVLDNYLSSCSQAADLARKGKASSGKHIMAAARIPVETYIRENGKFLPGNLEIIVSTFKYCVQNHTETPADDKKGREFWHSQARAFFVLDWLIMGYRYDEGAVNTALEAALLQNWDLPPETIESLPKIAVE